jgi:16S rRNA (cytidine1402-2'-O)-methyltransferase
MAGRLYLVATPIGNLEDITLRALRILREVDVVACEDTRHTRKLLSHYKISNRTISFHDHNERERTPELIGMLETGAAIALVSDAGSPLVSDPGYRLVTEAIARGVDVIPIPGPSALVAALTAAGLPTHSFSFVGFLPPRRPGRLARLAEFAAIPMTLVIYESPHRIKQTLIDACEVLGDRDCVVARELTKLHEQFLRGRLSEVARSIEDADARGEIVLLLGPPLDDALARAEGVVSLAEEVLDVMRAEGMDRKAALKRVARLRGMTKSRAYRLLIEEERSESSNDGNQG